MTFKTALVLIDGTLAILAQAALPRLILVTKVIDAGFLHRRLAPVVRVLDIHVLEVLSGHFVLPLEMFCQLASLAIGAQFVTEQATPWILFASMLSKWRVSTFDIPGERRCIIQVNVDFLGGGSGAALALAGRAALAGRWGRVLWRRTSMRMAGQRLAMRVAGRRLPVWMLPLPVILGWFEPDAA